MIHLTAPNHAADASLLLIRLIVGFSFLVAARNKGRNIKKFAKSNGLPLPAATLVMVTELVAGSALLLGVLGQYAALILMIVMLGTIRLHIFKWRSPYWASSGGWEYDLMLFTLCSVIVIYGAGQFVLLNN
jgi:putative oxidoreductase